MDLDGTAEEYPTSGFGGGSININAFILTQAADSLPNGGDIEVLRVRWLRVNAANTLDIVTLTELGGEGQDMDIYSPYAPAPTQLINSDQQVGVVFDGGFKAQVTTGGAGSVVRIYYRIIKKGGPLG